MEKKHKCPECADDSKDGKLCWNCEREADQRARRAQGLMNYYLNRSKG